MYFLQNIRIICAHHESDIKRRRSILSISIIADHKCNVSTSLLSHCMSSDKMRRTVFFCERKKKAVHAKLPVPGTDSWLDEKRFSFVIAKSIFQIPSLSFICIYIQWWIFQWAELLPFLLTHFDYMRLLCARCHIYRQYAVELEKLAAMSKNTNYPIRLFAIMLFILIRGAFIWIWIRMCGLGWVGIINMSYRFKESQSNSSKLSQIHISSFVAV